MKKLLASIALAGLASTANAIPVEWAVADGGNGHFYDFVAGDFTWHQALDESGAMTANGWEGYLATVTSQFPQQQRLESIGLARRVRRRQC